MATKKVQDLINKNAAFAADNYGAPPDFKFLLGLPRHTAVCIISCADPRLIPEQYFGFGMGEMPVIRVAGARVKDSLRSLLVLENALGLGGVVIVHHTDCGMTHLTDAGLKASLKEKCPQNAAEIDAMDFDEITDADLQTSVKKDIKFLKESPYFSQDLVVTGMIFDLNAGKVIETIS
ncbi:hypothetical protein OIDMADRAFT_60866 [Oidiodendron maius Zn]|uniref:Carbonic anhydrase n=1 Tax=Oidiodendron maius (strain Zn) TaxID=913774 RepID=A0A0C3GUG2_OIDMZ|nr:hypothetical protein OIDMADRAFT_60866 [Oidiodendron maius Zn]